MEPELRSFIKSNMSDEVLRSGSSNDVVKLLDIERVEVSHVVTPIPEPTRPDRRVRLAVYANARCRVILQRTGFFTLAILAGGSKYTPDRGELSEGSTAWLGGVDATGEVKSKQFRNIKFKSLLSSEQLEEESSKVRKAQSEDTSSS